MASSPHPRWEEHPEEKEKKERREIQLSEKDVSSVWVMDVKQTKIEAIVMTESNSSRVTFSCVVETPSEFPEELLKFVEECGIKLEEENK